MRPECIKAVTQAIGRPLNQQEIQGIENRVRRNMKQLAQTDTTWQSKTAADRLNEAAAKSAKDLVEEANLKKKRVALTILAHDRIDSYMKRFPDQPLEGLDRMLAFSAEARHLFFLPSRVAVRSLPSLLECSRQIPLLNLRPVVLCRVFAVLSFLRASGDSSISTPK